MSTQGDTDTNIQCETQSLTERHRNRHTNKEAHGHTVTHINGLTWIHFDTPKFTLIYKDTFKEGLKWTNDKTQMDT